MNDSEKDLIQWNKDFRKTHSAPVPRIITGLIAGILVALLAVMFSVLILFTHWLWVVFW